VSLHARYDMVQGACIPFVSYRHGLDNKSPSKFGGGKRDVGPMNYF